MKIRKLLLPTLIGAALVALVAPSAFAQKADADKDEARDQAAASKSDDKADARKDGKQDASKSKAAKKDAKSRAGGEQPDEPEEDGR